MLFLQQKVMKIVLLQIKQMNQNQLKKSDTSQCGGTDFFILLQKEGGSSHKHK